MAVTEANVLHYRQLVDKSAELVNEFTDEKTSDARRVELEAEILELSPKIISSIRTLGA